jgi:hypothetical protein
MSGKIDKILLEKYLKSNTHDWSEYRKMHEMEVPGSEVYKSNRYERYVTSKNKLRLGGHLNGVEVN